MRDGDNWVLVDPKEYSSIQSSQQANQGQTQLQEETKVDSSQKPKDIIPEKSAKSDFDYLCVLDFEAQCEDGKSLDPQVI
jgi:hypothetical protein